jgi:hypothetical protein
VIGGLLLQQTANFATEIPQAWSIYIAVIADIQDITIRRQKVWKIGR